MPWFERYPDRLERELQALRDQKIDYSEDEDAKKIGVLKLSLKYVWEETVYHLEAVFPDFYPYAPPEVQCEGAKLRRHWNPNGGNLCLIGRETLQWDLDYTLAQVITDRLPDILRFHKEGDENQIRAVEIPQGEPVSDYFNGMGTRNSFALFDSAWTIPAEVKSGVIEAVGYFRKEIGTPSAPCLIIKRISDEKGATICEWDGAPLTDSWGNGATYRFPWAKARPAPSGSTQEIADDYAAGRLGVPRKNISRQHRQEFFALIYDEEVQQFQSGLGLTVFELLFVSQSKMVELRPIRTFRCGQSDLAARMPSVAALRGKRVLLCGAGALGANVAMELARNGAGDLDVVDFDYVEPATTRRWLGGLEEFGKDKTDSVTEIVHRNYPWTVVRPHSIRIGGCRFDQNSPDQFDQITDLIASADCVVDMTAEVSANHILADMAAWSGKPYLMANATPGAWGGMVFQARPKSDDACWMCMRATLYPNSEYLPIADPDGLIHPPGCAARTFSGTSFDLAEIAEEAMRVLCGLLGGEYPATDWQLGVCNLRSENGRRKPPEWRAVQIVRREGCKCLKS